MITSIFLFIIGSFIAILQSLLSAITAILPDQISTKFTYLSSFFGYLSGVINFGGIFDAVTWYLIFLSLWFTFLGTMWFWHKLPFVGKGSRQDKGK